MQIIFIAGQMCAGKTTLSDILAGIAASQGLSVQRIKFADPIYALQSEVYQLAGMPVVKNRGLMQAIGDAVRANIGQSYFEDCVAAAIASSRADLILLDDMRFPGELELADFFGAKTVMVLADEEVRQTRGEALGTWSSSKHASEAGLPEEKFRFFVDNNGDLDDLNMAALKLWCEIMPPVNPADFVRPEPSDVPATPQVKAFVTACDALLQKHYGITVDDTGLEEEAEEYLNHQVLPFEAVNGFAIEADLTRLDGIGYLTEADEAAIGDVS